MLNPREAIDVRIAETYMTPFRARPGRVRGEHFRRWSQDNDLWQVRAGISHS